MFAATQAERGLFALDWENRQDTHRVTCADEEDYGRYIEDLLVGCWAYDESRIIAATQLQRVPPSRVAHLGVPATMECPDREADGPECFRENEKVFGLCVNRTCRRRCRQAADCTPFSSPGDPCFWECAPVERSVLGVCKQLPPLPP
ncbi:MAG TPA: hypothetical protein VM261_09020 [Kofleriaceae bacterium]|nr:hypothetical protein [Kofleriaceae bacterium]